MRYRGVGRSGLAVSAVALGCRDLGTRLDQRASNQVVGAALDSGVTLFDTADVYGKGASEAALGVALGDRRDEAVIATKFRWSTGSGPNQRGASRIHIRSAVEDSLRRLGTDRIDLYQIHAPDPATPIEETLAALDGLIASGKVLYAGSSNFSGWELVDADWAARVSGHCRLVSTHAPFSLLDLGAEFQILPAARHCGVGFLACLVLARGYLAEPTGGVEPGCLSQKELAFRTPQNAKRHRLISRFAEEYGYSIAEVAIGAVLDRPGVTAAVVGASSVEHVKANAAAITRPLPADALSSLLVELRG